MINFLQTLLLFSLSIIILSCDEGDDADSIELSVNNITGAYYYRSVKAKTAVDLDDDGIANTELLQETGRVCIYDNTITFEGNYFSVVSEGEKCEDDEENIIYQANYFIHISDPLITLTDESGNFEDQFTKVKLYLKSNGEKVLEFDAYDSGMDQTLHYVFIEK